MGVPVNEAPDISTEHREKLQYKSGGLLLDGMRQGFELLHTGLHSLLGVRLYSRQSETYVCINQA